MHKLREFSNRLHFFQPINQSAVVEAVVKAPSSPSKIPNNKHIIPVDSISVNKQLGVGEFGIVQQGVWTNGNERVSNSFKVDFPGIFKVIFARISRSLVEFDYANFFK